MPGKELEFPPPPLPSPWDRFLEIHRRKNVVDLDQAVAFRRKWPLAEEAEEILGQEALKELWQNKQDRSTDNPLPRR